MWSETRYMSSRTTVYLDSDILKALKLKAIDMGVSVSALINDSLRNELREDLEDLQAIRERANEETVSFEEVLRSLKLDETQS